MKKGVASLLVAALLFGMFALAGCGNNNKQQDTGKIEFKQFTNDDVVFENEELFVKNQLLITADEKYSYADVEKAVGNYGGKIVGCIEFTNDYQVEFENADYEKLTEIKTELSNNLPDSDITLHNAYSVTSSSMDYKESYTNDYSNRDGNWWRQAIRLTDLESKNYGYQKVKVGLIDTLFDTQNPDLSEYFVRDGVWYNDESKLAEEATGSKGNHGTNVAGFLAAKQKNGKGIDGVANNVSLFGYAYQGKEPKFITSMMRDKFALAKMLAKGIKIINTSYGYDNISVSAQQGVKTAIDDLDEQEKAISFFLRKYIDSGYEFVIVDSAGNTNDKIWIKCNPKEYSYGVKQYNPDTDGQLKDNQQLSKKIYTADYDWLGSIKDSKVRNRIIVVGSSTKENKRAEHSVCGQRVDIYAPGEELTKLTTGSNGGAGTSYATPIVSGIIALMWGINPSLSADRIKSTLIHSAVQPISDERYEIQPSSDEYEYKYLVNAYNAVEHARQIKDPLVIPLNDEGVLFGYVRKTDNNGKIEDLIDKCEISIYKGTVEDVHATLTDQNFKEPVAQLVETNAYGEFDIDLPEGDYYLSASYNNNEYQSVIKTFRIIKGEVCYLDDIILTKTIKHNTAMDLIDKSLSEIVELMGNDYNLERKDFSPAFGTGGGTLMIYNENTMPGLAVCPSYSSGIYKDIENGSNVRDKIQQGSYTYDGIAIVGNGKLNEKISANMTYNELAAVIGDFEPEPAAQSLRYVTEIDGYSVSFWFAADISLKDGKVPSADMKSNNPKLESIAVHKAKKSSSEIGISSNAEWKKLYIDYINNEYSRISKNAVPEYSLVKINNDDIPELFIVSQNGASVVDRKYLMAWIDEGRVCEDSCFISGYSEKSGMFWGQLISHGASIVLWEFDGKRMNTIQTTLSYTNYYVDNQPVDEATYNNTIAKIKNYGNEEPIYVSKDEILKQIKQY